MGLFGGNRENGFRPTRSTPITKVTPSGRRVMRAKMKIYEPPAKTTRAQVRRDYRDTYTERHQARNDVRDARRSGAWGLFSK